MAAASKADTAEFEAWLATGYDRGWVLGPWCFAHDVPPLTDEDRKLEDEIGEDQMLDVCVFAYRLEPPRR